MIRTPMAAAALALSLAACSDQAPASAPSAATPPDAAADEADAGCNVSAQHVWIEQETPIRRYTVDAVTSGPTCQQAVAMLVVRAREGTPLYTWSAPAEQVFGLRDATDAAAMKTALAGWIANDTMLQTTEQLPAWSETDGQANRAEFPFMPESWIDEATWTGLKGEKLDMFCFPQGMESLRCATLRDGTMEDIGLQLFPG